MKLRVVHDGYGKYKPQYKGWFFWHDIVDIIHTTYGSWVDQELFDTVEDAEKYGITRMLERELAKQHYNNKNVVVKEFEL